LLIKTHYKYALRLYEYINIHTEIDINKTLFCLGSIFPDLTFPKCLIKLHSIYNYKKELIKLIKRLKNSKNGFVISFLLGIILHIIQDSFCHYHNSANDVVAHLKWEKDINDNYNPHLIDIYTRAINTNDIRDWFNIINEGHTYYTICEKSIELDSWLALLYSMAFIDIYDMKGLI